jgi:uncharacterized membrane protein
LCFTVPVSFDDVGVVIDWVSGAVTKDISEVVIEGVPGVVTDRVVMNTLQKYSNTNTNTLNFVNTNTNTHIF